MTIAVGNPNEYTGKLWPNGEFGYASVRRTNPSSLAKRDDSEDARWQKAALSVHGLSESIRYFSPQGKTAAFLRLVPESQQVDPLGLSNVPKSHKKARGSSGLTSYGGRMLRNACYLMQKTYGKDRLSFLTLTLPDLKEDDWESVYAGWPEALRNFFQWLGRKQEAAGLDKEFVSCTEIQMERYESRGEVAPHIHCVFVGRRAKKGWIVTPKQVAKAWKRCLAPYLRHSLTCYSWNSVENLVRVKKNVEAYLSKYLSKGYISIAALGQASDVSIPVKSWWNSSLRMKKWVKREVRTLNSAGVHLIQNLKTELGSQAVPFMKSVTVETVIYVNGISKAISIPVGTKGVLTELGRSIFRALISK